MYDGDRSRKKVLVEHGFRLPRPGQPAAALRGVRGHVEPGDVRHRHAGAVRAAEDAAARWSSRSSARPGWSIRSSKCRPARGQVPDLLQRDSRAGRRGERVLVTTLTKRLAEDLTAYIEQQGLRGRYLHSEIDTLERVEILRELRRASSTCWWA